MYFCRGALGLAGHLAPVLTPLTEDRVEVGREGQQLVIDPKLFEDSSEGIVLGRVRPSHMISVHK